MQKSNREVVLKRKIKYSIWQFFCKKTLTNPHLFSIIVNVHRGLVQSVEHRSPKPSVVGSSPPAPAKKNPSLMTWIFFICAVGTTSFAWHTQYHLSVNSTSLPPCAAQMNEVALRANDVLRNDVMLRINDVALRANGIKRSLGSLKYS